MTIPALFLTLIIGALTMSYEQKEESRPTVKKEEIVTFVGPDNPQSREYKIGKINWKKVKKRR